MAGAMDAYVEGLAYMGAGGGCTRKPPTWAYNQSTLIEVPKEMAMFYEEGSNISLPMIDAYTFSEMKIAGATKEELEDYLTVARKYAK